jgi:hypothetical protein
MNKMNKIIAMFDLDKCRAMIANCPPDEVVILCPNWPINKPSYEGAEDPETEDWDFQELEDQLGTTLMVSDYNDLIADPHGIMFQ